MAGEKSGSSGKMGRACFAAALISIGNSHFYRTALYSDKIFILAFAKIKRITTGHGSYLDRVSCNNTKTNVALDS